MKMIKLASKESIMPLKPGQTSLEVQSWDISDPTERTYALQKF